MLQDFAEFIFSWSDIDFGNIFLPTLGRLESTMNRLICAPENFIRGFSKLFSLFNSELCHTIKIGFGTIPNRDAILSQSLLYRPSGDIVSFGEFLNTHPLAIEEQQFLNRQLFKIMRLSAESIGLSVNSIGSEMFTKIVSVYGKPQSDLTQTKTLGIEGFRIIDKAKSKFSGHVYNLETEQGYYSIRDKNSSLVVHNCRCVAIPVLERLLDI